MAPVSERWRAAAALASERTRAWPTNQHDGANSESKRGASSHGADERAQRAASENKHSGTGRALPSQASMGE